MHRVADRWNIFATTSSRWQQLSLSIVGELHEANVMFNIKWNKVIR